jgi:hypothetical protein
MDCLAVGLDSISANNWIDGGGDSLSPGGSRLSVMVCIK